MKDSKLSPDHIKVLFLQLRTMSSYLDLLQRRLIDLKLTSEEPEFFEYLTHACETVDYLKCYLHDRHLENSRGGWDRPFKKMMRPERKLKCLK